MLEVYAVALQAQNPAHLVCDMLNWKLYTFVVKRSIGYIYVPWNSNLVPDWI